MLEVEVKARVMSVERGIGGQGDYLKIHSNACARAREGPRSLTVEIMTMHASQC